MSVNERNEKVMFETPQCASCIHFDLEGVRCEAYPDGIPDVVFGNELIHDKVLPGQTGTVIFKRKKLQK